ncbi:DUF4158 domain-containing protein [Kribbella catacumbae]|uniref:DUF4158 domain-containing protein n=1 Tax=Kribbella catacumbae TaxID=460086 RepID=UPI00039BFA79|nr:DUF4158 domain-containing protein [Kribbella catacumbae]
MDRSVEIDELVEGWTLLPDEQDLVAGKRGATRLGFALLSKFYGRHGRFPRGQAELPDDVVAFVARQVGVAPSELGMYEWSGRTVEFHRSQVRRHLGFRECSVEDADKLASWLAAEVCEVERQHDRVREQLLVRCRAERIEPPTTGRVDRVVRSALRQAEVTVTSRTAARLPASTAARLEAQVSGIGDAADDADAVLALVKSDLGNVSLESMLTEIKKTACGPGHQAPGWLVR